MIGCCVNLIDNTCFYTKNGVNLGETPYEYLHLLISLYVDI